MDKIQNNLNIYNQKKSVNFQADKSADQPSAVQIPDLYYFDTQITTKHKGEKKRINPFLELPLEFLGITPWIENPLLMAPVTAATLYGVGKFSETFSGEYEKSSVGKAGKFGDKIGGSGFMQSNAVKTIKSKSHSGAQAVKKFLCKNDAIRAMFETPAMPEWSMGKHEMKSAKQRFLENFNRITATLGVNKAEVQGSGVANLMMNNEGGVEALSLETLGMDKAEKEFIKSKYNTLNYSKIPEAEQSKLINRILLNRLKTEIPELTDEKINQIISSTDANKQVQDKICEALHLTREEIEEISKDTSGKYVDKVKEALGKMKNKDAIRIGSGRQSFFPASFQPFERKITMSSVFNNLYSISDGTKTLTGKMMARATQITQRCLTIGGGKIAVLIFIAPALYRAISNTTKADKDQKPGTFVNTFLNGVFWIVTFPLAMKFMHSVGGMKYAGMTPEEVQHYRDELKILQENNMKGEYKTKADYKKAAEKVLNIKKNASNLKNQSLFTKLGKAFASFLEVGNENVKAWNNPKSAKIVKWFRNKNFHRMDLIGAPVRFILFMAVFQKILDGVVEKGVTKIFGKSYDEMGADEYIEKKKAQEIYTKEDLKKRMLEIQAQKQSVKINETSQEPIQNQADNDIMATEKAVSAQKINEAEPMVDNMPASELDNNNLTNETAQESVQNQTDNGVIATEKAIAKQNMEEANPSVGAIQNLNYNDKKVVTEKQPTKTYTYIPSSENVIKKNVEKQVKNRYVPSQQAANITKTFDNSNLNSALARADKAEQRALNILAGKFEN